VKKCFIYGLFDPREPDEFRVVGKTQTSLRLRLGRYISAARLGNAGFYMTPGETWIAALLSEGIRANIRLIEKCDRRVWRQRERRAITLYRNCGHRLLNKHKGGNGADDGKFKTHCSTCGTRKKTTPGGIRYCPECKRQRDRSPEMKRYRQEYDRKPERRAYRKVYDQTPASKAIRKAYANSPRGKARQAELAKRWRQTPIGRSMQKARNSRPENVARRKAWEASARGQEVLRRWRRSEKNRTRVRIYMRDRRHAKKLGLTVAQYRAKANG
jgi:hypothetical protein